MSWTAREETRTWDPGIEGKPHVAKEKSRGFILQGSCGEVLRYGQTFILSGHCVNRH